MKDHSEKQNNDRERGIQRQSVSEIWSQSYQTFFVQAAMAIHGFAFFLLLRTTEVYQIFFCTGAPRYSQF